jgi:hypothetical protein
MRATLLLLLLLPLLSGCGRRADATGIDDDQFVEAMVQLRRAAERTRLQPDSFPPERERVLANAGVTEEQLLAYVQAHGTDLQHMATIWESINQRLADPDDQ